MTDQQEQMLQDIHDAMFKNVADVDGGVPWACKTIIDKTRLLAEKIGADHD